jgi:hypothetical protein
MSTKSHTHKSCGILGITPFYTREYAEIQIERPFFDSKKWHMRKSCIENPNNGNML